MAVMMTAESLEPLVGGYRLAPYLIASKGDRLSAVGLYLWNIEVSSSFWTPLSLVEIALRNTMSDAFSINKGKDWCLSPQEWIADEDARRLDQIRSRLRQRGVVHPTVDHVVNDSHFGLWTGFLGPGLPRHPKLDYETQLWQRFLHRSFPEVGIEGRKALHRLASDVRQFRNQVAHHSPIFHRDLDEMLATVESLARIIDPALGVFIQENHSVSELLKRRP